MIDEAASFDGRMAKVQGPARSGKTEVLVRRVARLIHEGTNPATILVEATSGFAVQAFRHRLAAALGESDAQRASEVEVLTPLGVCVRVLSDPLAQKALGRAPRVLLDGEFNVVVEDLKTLGLPLRALRGILERLSFKMENLRPRSEWCGNDEERAVLDRLTSALVSRNALLRWEAAAHAVEFLQSDEGASVRASYGYVLCDDFQNLSRAQQTCLCLLASAQLVVAGNPNQTTCAASDHPCPQGFSQFDAVRRSVRSFTLQGAFARQPITAFIDALCEQGDMDPSLRAGKALLPAKGHELEVVKWPTPEDELDGVAACLRSLVAAEGEPVAARTCVLVPNRRWAILVAERLRSCGLEASTAGSLSGIGGDPRESRRARALAAYTKLALLADPGDMAAWRSWCAFDHSLANSDAWANLSSYAHEQGISLFDALACTGCVSYGGDNAHSALFLRSGVLASRWREGRRFIESNAERRGFTLIRAIGAQNLREFEGAIASMTGNEDAAELLSLARKHAIEPVWPDNPHAFRIATCDAACGTEFDYVLAIGMVDGFMPCRDAFEVVSTDEAREAAANRCRRLFANAAAKAKNRLLISYFSKADLELAERAKMQVVRVRAENGARMAVARPSSLLAEAGASVPATRGGQRVLAEHGLI